MGALSVDQAARCLNAREIDGIAIADGLPQRSLEAFLTVLAEDARFRDLPVAALGAGNDPGNLPNFLRALHPQLLVERLLPLVRLRAFEAGLKRLLKSIECKGMLDPQTGLLHERAFGHDLERAIEDAGERGVSLSIARFAFENAIDRRTSMDAARLVSRLVRQVDFGCRQDDGSILCVFTETDLRAAHVVARRLASILKNTMVKPDHERMRINASVTLATLKSTDTLLTLMARVAPRPVAAA
jgi:GGDEF domain-containing protein